MLMHVNGINLFYEVSGSGRPLIMVHGNGEDHTIFKEAVDILNDHFRVYAIDSRDHGQSSKVSDLHYSDMADDILVFMNDLNLTDVTFYGFSDGGILGLLLAQKIGYIPEVKGLSKCMNAFCWLPTH